MSRYGVINYRVCKHNQQSTIPGHDDSNPSLLTAGSDGRVVEWMATDGSTRVVTGEGHGSQVNGLVKTKPPQVQTVGIDDSMKTFDQNTVSYISGSATKLKSQPRGLDCKGDLTVITSVNGIMMVNRVNFLYFWQYCRFAWISKAHLQ